MTTIAKNHPPKYLVERSTLALDWDALAAASWDQKLFETRGSCASVGTDVAAERGPAIAVAATTAVAAVDEAAGLGGKTVDQRLELHAVAVDFEVVGVAAASEAAGARGVPERYRLVHGTASGSAWLLNDIDALIVDGLAPEEYEEAAVVIQQQFAVAYLEPWMLMHTVRCYSWGPGRGP